MFLIKKLRFGIIGCSRIALSSTIPAILQSKFASLEYIGSRDILKAETFSKKFQCKKFGSYQDVLNDNHVDVVYVSLPIGLHEEWVIKAARAKKHILCEKSSTTSYESAKKMVNACKKHNVRLMEGFMFRFHPSHQKVNEIIKTGKIGKIFSFYGKYGFSQVPFDDIRYKKELGGGILNDAGCYPICASRIIFGKEPQSAFYSPVIDKKSGIDVKGVLFLKYDDNKFAHMEFGYGLFYQSKYEIWGDKGHLRLSRAYNIPPDMSASLIVESTNKKETFIKPTNHFRLMIDSFSKQVLNVAQSCFNFESDLLIQAKILEAARNSHLKNKPVNV
ncbi:Gfo/Idh/MocA family protein [Candidatus Nitrosotenuis cloacae]|uniref:Gfo/Idh/MocA family protein n=1 Tax=Candidatus Nitrosotenuis cloacae TaxID=1603555 RepID=UPI00227F7728|nr:Gfo/Idh/MocA family oxidoreductase [Candidatus Nitrosotenuis cloacae]